MASKSFRASRLYGALRQAATRTQASGFVKQALLLFSIFLLFFAALVTALPSAQAQVGFPSFRGRGWGGPRMGRGPMFGGAPYRAARPSPFGGGWGTAHRPRATSAATRRARPSTGLRCLSIGLPLSRGRANGQKRPSIALLLWRAPWSGRNQTTKHPSWRISPRRFVIRRLSRLCKRPPMAEKSTEGLRRAGQIPAGQLHARRTRAAAPDRPGIGAERPAARVSARSAKP